ncbi:hypothetical protein MnTg02_01558 [bacterium MnTg02]|nr:hypothetical protein MnTg02_01558 [bacterium MnTg02]
MARDHIANTAAKSCPKWQQHGPLHGLAGWANHEEHANKASEHRQPAPPADIFPESKRRHCCDEQRTGECNGYSIGERQVNQPVDEQEGARNNAAGPQRLALNVLNTQSMQPAVAKGQQQYPRAHEGTPDEQQFTHRITAGQRLDQRIIERKKSHAGNHADHGTLRLGGRGIAHGVCGTETFHRPDI